MVNKKAAAVAFDVLINGTKIDANQIDSFIVDQDLGQPDF